MDADLDRSIARWRRRAALGAFAGRFLRAFAFSAALLGALVLLLRAGFGLESRAAALAFLPLAILPLVAWSLARRRVPSRAATAAWIDVESGGSGALVSGYEFEDARWQGQIAAALARAKELPALRLRRHALGALGGLALAALALFLPLPERVIGPPLAIQEAQLERVEEELAALEEQVELEPELAEELRESLKRLQQEGALADPESAFEALDGAERRLEQEALETAETAQSAQEELERAAAEAAADPLAAQERLERAIEQLARAGLAKDVREALEQQLGVSGLELPPGLQLDAAALRALSSELSEALGKRMQGLAKAGLLDARALERLGELAALEGFEPTHHECDESCEKKPGGT